MRGNVGKGYAKEGDIGWEERERGRKRGKERPLKGGGKRGRENEKTKNDREGRK